MSRHLVSPRRACRRLVWASACVLAPSLALLAAGPLRAASSTASSASEGASASVGSLSTSIKHSSASSSRATGVAEGPYRIIDVADAADQPGLLRLALEPQSAAAGAADDDKVIHLLLPRSTAERARLGRGDVVAARTRPYGVEFARADDGQAFFLVLHDEWQRELPSHPVRL